MSSKMCVTLLRVLLAAGLWHAASSQDYEVTERVVDFEGAPVIPGTFDNVTVEACQAFCNANSTCHSFSFCGSSCYLKQACIVAGEPLVNASTWTSGCVTYYKPCPELAAYTSMGVVVEQGGGVDNIMTNSLGTCAEACNTNPQCKSFTFYAPSQGCHLKEKCLEPTDAKVSADDPASVYRSFYRCCTCTTTTTTTTPSPWQVLPRALEWEGIPVIPGSFEGTHTVAQCQAFCDTNSSCKSFTFCDASCYLKQQCVTADQAIVPAEGWNGCLTYYKPCGSDPSGASTSANATSNSSNSSEDVEEPNSSTSSSSVDGTSDGSTQSSTSSSQSYGNLVDVDVDNAQAVSETGPQQVAGALLLPCALAVCVNWCG